MQTHKCSARTIIANFSLFRWCCSTSSQLHFNFLMECSIVKVVHHWILRIKCSEAMRIKEFLVSIFSLSTHEIVVETQNSVMDIFSPSKAWIYRCTNWLNVWWEKWNEQRQEEREMRNGCAFEPVIKCIGMQNFNCKDKQNCPLWINRSVAQSLTQMCNISSMVCPHTFINYTKQGLAAVLRFAINLHSM